MSVIKTGDILENFTLENQYKDKIKLSDFRGKKVLLSFHPLAWTGVCEIQMRTLEQKFNELRELNTVPLGISVDSLPCKAEWAEYLDLEKTDLLCDFWPHGEVAKKYGIFIEKAGISKRANILIDEEGKVIFFREYEIPEVPDIEEIISFLKNK